MCDPDEKISCRKNMDQVKLYLCSKSMKVIERILRTHTDKMILPKEYTTQNKTAISQSLFSLVTHQFSFLGLCIGSKS